MHTSRLGGGAICWVDNVVQLFLRSVRARRAGKWYSGKHGFVPASLHRSQGDNLWKEIIEILGSCKLCSNYASVVNKSVTVETCFCSTIIDIMTGIKAQGEYMSFLQHHIEFKCRNRTQSVIIIALTRTLRVLLAST